MTHAEALNMIIANSCSNPSSENPAINVYIITLCCTEMVVKAKPLSIAAPFEYEIISVEERGFN